MDEEDGVHDDVGNEEDDGVLEAGGGEEDGVHDDV